MEGIKDQIEGSNKYSGLTKEKLEEITKDFFYGDGKLKEPKIFQPFKELPQGFNLDDQIKDGYMYECRGGKINLSTGVGGIMDIIKAMRESGIPDFLIAQDIYVFDYDTGNGGESHRIILMDFQNDEPIKKQRSKVTLKEDGKRDISGEISL